MLEDTVKDPRPVWDFSYVKCPPAIVTRPEDVNQITRSDVAKERRRFFSSKQKSYDPMKPEKGTKPMKAKEKIDKTDEWVKKIQAHALKYYPKTKRQRRWDIIAECWGEDDIKDLIHTEKANDPDMNWKKLIRIFDRVVDNLAEAELNARE